MAIVFERANNSEESPVPKNIRGLRKRKSDSELKRAEEVEIEAIEEEKEEINYSSIKFSNNFASHGALSVSVSEAQNS